MTVPVSRKLSTLVGDAQASVAGDDRDILGMTADSRAVKAGFLFAAFPGSKSDGRDFIPAAIDAGAVAILAPAGIHISLPSHVTLVTHAQPRLLYAQMAARFFNAAVPYTVAVTGTNGKSSTVHFCRLLWNALGYKGASLGTVGITGPGIHRESALTTPDSLSLHRDIAELATAGATHLAMEASSMGLDQYRLHAVKLSAAAFSNLTRDHLDYHGCMENYLAAKEKLFTEVLDTQGTAVINTDDSHGAAIAARLKAAGRKTLTVGHATESHIPDICITTRTPVATGSDLHIAVMGKTYRIAFPLIGSFQSDNALLALGLVLAEKSHDAAFRDRAVAALETLTSVRGRLEHAVTLQNGAAIYVDYAHTPDGLETMLTAVRPHAQKRLLTVFGCGGDRDRGKRPMMGEIAARLSDHAIITDDNPRSENPEAIRADVAAGIPAGAAVENIGGRREAIAAAITRLQPGDLLVIAGKGHEQGQTISGVTYPFDDVTVARDIAATTGTAEVKQA